MIKECGMVSVIVPIYNGEKFLNRCLDSILGQSYKNLEIICIDDGSTDFSYNILQEYESKVDKVHVVFQGNQGVSAARNTGIRQAKGRYVTFVDCDDYIEEYYVENLVQYMINQNDIVMTGFVDEKGGRSIRNDIFLQDHIFDLDNDLREKFMTDAVSPRTFSFLNVKRDIGFSSGKLYSLPFIKEKQLLFDEEIKLYEDLLFFLHCLLYASRIEYVCSKENAWYHYVFQSDSSSNKKDCFRYREQEKYIDRLYKVSLEMDKLDIDTMHYMQAVYVTTVKMIASNFKQYFYDREFPVEMHVQRMLVNQILTSKIWEKAIWSVKLKSIKHESGFGQLIFIILCCRYKWTHVLEVLVRTYKYIKSFVIRGKKSEFNLHQCKRILVIVAGAWGDTTMMIPFFRLLRQQSNNAVIKSLCVTEIAKKNLSELNLINEVIGIPKEISGGKNMCRHPIKLRKFVNNINIQKPFDLAICLSPSLGLSAMLHLIQANVYVGYSKLKGEVFWDYSVNWNARNHHIDKFLCLLEEMGCHVQSNQRIPQINITDDIIQKGKLFVKKNNLNNKYIIGIGIGASCKTRKWILFRQLIAELNKIDKMAILLFGSLDETDEINDIISKAYFRDRIFSISCELSELKNYMSICNLIIGNDSGLSHYGAACGIDTIQIRGCVKGSTTGARGNGKVIILEDDKLECRGKEESVCPKGTYECLSCTTVEQVENIVLELWQKYKNDLKQTGYSV